MKKALSLFLAVTFILTSSVFASPVSNTGVENAAEKPEAEISALGLDYSNAELCAKSSAPGLNIFTGLPGAISFEEDADSTFGSLFSLSGVNSATVGIVDNPISDSVNSSAKTFAFSSTVSTGEVKPTDQDYPNIRMALPQSLEPERPMYVTMNYYRSNPGTSSEFNAGGNCWWIMKNSSGATDVVFSKTQSANSGTWAFTGGYVDFTKSGAHTNTINNLAFQANRYKSDIYATTYYIDNLAVIPGYKLTYKMNNGTSEVYRTEYVKCDLTGPEGGAEHTLVSGTPTDETATFIGWALSNTAKEADVIDKVTLANKDVTLYAVWDGDPTTEVSTEPVLEYTFDTDKEGWSAWGSITCTQQDGCLSLVRTTSANGAINSPTSLGIDTLSARYAVIRLKNETASANLRFYFSDGTAAYNETNTFSFKMPTAMTDFETLTVKLSDNANWTGTVNKFMVAIYSVEDKPVLIDSIDFYTALPKEEIKPTLEYTFDDNTTTGWSAGGQASIAADDGKLVFTQNVSSGYAAMYTPSNLALTPDSARYILVKVKNATSSTRIHMYFAPDNNTYSEANSLYVPIAASMDGYKTFVYDTSACAAFTAMNIINKFMINVSAQGVCEFDTIAFYADNPVKEDLPVKEYTFDSDKEGWSAWGVNTLTWVTGGTVSATCSGSGQGAVNSPVGIGLSSDSVKYINVRAKNNSKVGSLRFYFEEGNNAFNEAKTFNFPINTSDKDYVDYVKDLSTVTTWGGNIDKFMITFAGTDGTLDIDYIRFYTTLPETLKPEEIPTVEYSMSIKASATSITQDKGTVTITPTVKSTDKTVPTTVSYSTDNNNAVVTKNADNTLTVQGMINGSVKVTAISDYDGSLTDSVTINISGQADRTAAYDLDMLMFGNSILKHGVAESIGWHNDWGMAASAEEKDYVHRLKYYLSDKYGTVEQGLYGFAAFERSIVADDAYDYTSVLGFVGESFKKLSSTPEIITIQMGENVATPGLSATQYKNAVVQFIKELRKYAPDAQIICCTPFWGGDEKINGMKAAAEEMGCRVAYLHTLNTSENKALGLFEHSGVASHPGDLGMDNIAKLIFAQLNTALTENVRPEYVVCPQTITITSETDKITSAYGTLSLGVTATPSDASTSVKWTSSNEDIATVDADGTVTAKNDGKVIITATSKIVGTVTAEKEITISGQTPSFNLVYDANTADVVTGLPETNSLAKENITLSDVIPERLYYIFAGWATSKDSKTAQTELYVTEDTTVYAIWKPATSWDFSIDGYRQGVTVENGFNIFVLEGKLMSIATDTNAETGNIIKFVSPKLNINSDDYSSFILKMQNTAKTDSTKLTLTITSDVDTYTLVKDVTSITPTSYVFDISEVQGTITGFYFTPTDTDCTINIDEMGFASNTVTYHANTADAVTGLPESDYAVGDVYTVSDAVPVRAGYNFVGWATGESSSLPVKTITADRNLDLYAIWDAACHWEFNTLDEANAQTTPGNSTYVDVTNGVLSVNAISSTDPILNLKNVNIDASKFKHLEVRIAYQLASDTSTTMQVFFTTDSDTALGESKSVRYTMKGQESDGFITVKLDMSSNSAWNGTVKVLRIDPISYKGNYQFDYVRFTDNDDEYVYTVNEGYTTDGKDLLGHKRVVLGGGTIKPSGNLTLENLAISEGSVDTSDGMLAVSGVFEASDDCGYTRSDLSQKPEGCPDFYTVSDSDGNTLDSSAITSGTGYVLHTGKSGTYLIYNAEYDYSVIRRINPDGTFCDITGNPLLSHNAASIRSTGVQGIRFMASVNENVFDYSADTAKVVEYGFVIGRGSVFATGAQPTLSDVENGTAVTGVAYNSVKHVSYDFLDGRDMFTCVVKNVPMTKEALSEQLVMVPYIKVSNGSTTSTLYGQSVRRSILEVAEAIEAVGEDDYTLNQEYIDSIIMICYDLV